MSISRDEALRKIRACMRLAKSSNPHEAAAAMRQAAALMRKYQVNEADVADTELRCAEARVRGRAGKPIYGDVCLVKAIERVFGVTGVFGCSGSRHVIRFGGDGASAEIAAHAFENLVGQRRRACSAQLKRVRKASNKRKRADAFQTGWSIGFWDAVGGSEELTLAEQIAHDARVQRMTGGNSTTLEYGDATTGKSARDLEAGYEAGYKARVQRGVGQSQMALEHQS